MTYDFYLTTATAKRKDAALTGLAAGTLQVQDLTHTAKKLTAIVTSDTGKTRHGYEVRIGWDGMTCGCKDWEHYGRQHYAACKHLLATMLVDQRHANASAGGLTHTLRRGTERRPDMDNRKKEKTSRRRSTIATNVIRVRRAAISPDPEQPRKTFDENGIQELARSLDSNGLLQPIIIRPAPVSNAKDRRYILIAGERRWRAAGVLGWETIPSIVRKDLTDAAAAKLQLLENIVRCDLNPVEEARALQKMLDEGATTQELSDAVGLAPAQISWRVQMLHARDNVLDLVAAGHLKPSVAFDLSKLSADGQTRVVHAIRTHNLNANAVTKLCAQVSAEENQVEMFPAVTLSAEERQAAQTFGSAFERICTVLTSVERMRQEQPEVLLRALEAEAGVIEERLTLTIRGLNGVRSLLEQGRMNRLAKAL